MATPGVISGRVDQSFVEGLLGEPLQDFKIAASGCKKGDNVAGSLKTLKVTTKGGETYDMICKLPPEDSPPFLSYIIQCRVMENENEFYSRVHRDLKGILDENSPANASLPFPRYFGGAGNYLMLEDLRPQGYRMADKFAGLTLAEASLVLKSVGRYHALSYFYLRQRGEQFFEISESTRLFNRFQWEPPEMTVEDHRRAIGILTAAAEVMKNDIDEELGQILEDLVPRFHDLFPGIHRGTDTKYFPIICLGDLWVNNILFKYDTTSTSTPIDLKFIDFQQSHRGNIYEDLMYFFVTSTTPALRKKHLLTLLQFYYDSFSSTLSQLDCPLPLGFTIGFFIDNFYDNLLNIAVLAGGAIGFQLVGPSDDPVDPVDAKSEEKPKPGSEPGETQEDFFVLKTYPAETLAPLGDFFDSFFGIIKSGLESSARGRARFLDIMREFQALGVFSS